MQIENEDIKQAQTAVTADRKARRSKLWRAFQNTLINQRHEEKATRTGKAKRAARRAEYEAEEGAKAQ